MSTPEDPLKHRFRQWHSRGREFDPLRLHQSGGLSDGKPPYFYGKKS